MSPLNIAIQPVRAPAAFTRWLLLTVILVSAFAARPAFAQGNAATISPAACAANCLRSASITLSAPIARDSAPITITGVVVVVDEKGTPVSGASVFAIWQTPAGARIAAKALTNQKGEAVFKVMSSRGTTTLKVSSLVMPGYIFDPANSVLSKSITR